MLCGNYLGVQYPSIVVRVRCGEETVPRETYRSLALQGKAVSQRTGAWEMITWTYKYLHM